MIDVFLVQNGIAVNTVVIESLAFAQELLPDLTVIQRTEDNVHINPGEPMS
jgi:hypothetical protein